MLLGLKLWRVGCLAPQAKNAEQQLWFDDAANLPPEDCRTATLQGLEGECVCFLGMGVLPTVALALCTWASG